MALYFASQLNYANFDAGGGGGGSPSGPAGGSLAGNFPNPTLAPTGTPIGTFGGATTSPQITIGADGRVTNVTNVAIAVGGGNPSGPAGGDLGGLYPNPILAQKNGVAIYGGSDGYTGMYFGWGNPNIKEFHGQQVLSNDGSGFVPCFMISPGASKGMAYVFIYGNGSLQGTYQALLAISFYQNGGLLNQTGGGIHELKTNQMGDAAFQVPTVPVFNDRIQIDIKNGNGNVFQPVTWTYKVIIIV